MDKYIGSDGSLRSNELRHWKYVKKIPVGKGYRYFYSMEEYRAYLADPEAKLKETGNRVKKDLEGLGRRGQSEIRKQKQKVVKTTKSSVRSNPPLSSVKRINGARSEATKKKLNEIAKQAKKTWTENREAAKKKAEKGKQWFSEKTNAIRNPIKTIKKYAEEKRKEWEEERKRKEAEKKRKEAEKKRKEAAKRESLAKKYKYIKKIMINGKAHYFYSQDEIDTYNKRARYMKNEPDFMKDFAHSDTPFTSHEDAIQVNPKYDPTDWDENYEVNCAQCTAIYELRRRGYDVESNGNSGNGPDAEIYNTDKRYDLFYEDPNIVRLKPIKKDGSVNLLTDNDIKAKEKALNDAFANMPPGSRGDISFKWEGHNAGHSIAWEVDKKGQVTFIDTQISGSGSRATYTTKDLAKTIDMSTTYKRNDFDASDKSLTGKFEKASSVRIVRTDNLELKPDIKNICQNTNPKKRKRPNTLKVVEYEGRNGLLGAGWNETTRRMTQEEKTKYYSNLM